MLDLRPKDLRLLEHLIATRLPPSVEVWAYGSRVNGDAYEGSDLDLVLRGAELEEIPVRVFAGFREAVSESNLPILVDVHDWAHLPERFHARILARYEVLRPAQAEAPVAAVAGL